MTEKKTCGDCPYWRCGVLGTHCNFADLSPDCPEEDYPECPARKAYRILRDEVRSDKDFINSLMDSNARLESAADYHSGKSWKYKEAFRKCRDEVRRLRKGVNKIASWPEGKYWREGAFDEPWSAREAREILGKFEKEP